MLSYYKNSRASEKKRELIKLGLTIAVSVAVSVIIFSSAVSITISRLDSDVSDLREAFVQLDLSFVLHRAEMNPSLAARHNETADELENVKTKLAEMQDQLIPKVRRFK